MELHTLWKTQITGVSASTSCHSLCFKRDYSQLIVATSNSLFFLDPSTGKVVDHRRSRYSEIYCVRCSYDGLYFASSSSDGFVVIWRSTTNEGFVTYSSESASRHIIWCPTQPLLISCSNREYSTWQPGEPRASRNKTSDDIEGIAFSPSGQAFLLSFASGTVSVLSTETHDVLQTFSYKSIVTCASFATVAGVEYIIIADLDCKVSMFRASDKALVGKNTIPFEALSMVSISGPPPFFAFAGVSGKISLMSSGLSYLGDFDTNSRWIWDVDVDNNGRLAIGTKEGFVELCSVEFGLTFACARDIVAYRTSINAISCYNIHGKCLENLVFVKIIVALCVSSDFLLVQFKDGLFLYAHEINSAEELVFKKMYEIPGMFEKAIMAITGSHIFSANGKEMIIYDISGLATCTLMFQTNITWVSSTTCQEDGVIVGCVDGSVYYVLAERDEPVLLVKHKSAIVSARKQGLIVAAIGKEGGLMLVNCFEQKVLEHCENMTSFAFSDRVDDLYVMSDGSTVSIFYKQSSPKTIFVEGYVLSFMKGVIVILNNGALEMVRGALPIEELLEVEDWDGIVSMMTLELTSEQWSLIAVKALEMRNFDVAKLAAPHVNNNLSFFVSEIAPGVPVGRWKKELRMFFGKMDETEPDEKEDSDEVISEPEMICVNEETMHAYASKGDWNTVLRLAQENHLERCIVNYHFPPEVSEAAARVLLDAGLGDGAVRILAKTRNVESLARAHVFLGQWSEAISLSRLYPSVYNVVYLRFGQLLFENGQWFESLICFFITRDRETRNKALCTIFDVSAGACACDKLAFVRLMLGLCDPDCYWQNHAKALCYIAAHRLKEYMMLSLAVTDAEVVFYLAYYVMACIHDFPMRGIHVRDVLMQLLVAASMLQSKRWVAYSLKELRSLDLKNSMKQLAQRAVHAEMDLTGGLSFAVLCPRCGKDIYSSSRVPRRCCGSCGMTIAFSAWSCRALPLAALDYSGTDALDLIQRQTTKRVKETLPPTMVTDEFLIETPSDLFVSQSLKDTACVPVRLWYNGVHLSVRTCKSCGSMFTEEDYEDSILDTEFCPVCRAPDGNDPDANNDVIDMLRTFEADSPMSF